MHAHISAPMHDLTLGMSDHAQRRCTGHATAGRCTLLDKVALNVGPLQGHLHLLQLRAWVLPLGNSSYLGECYRQGWAQWRSSSSRVKLIQNASGSAGLLLASTNGSCHCHHNPRNNSQAWLFLLKMEKWHIVNHIFLGCYLVCQMAVACQPSVSFYQMSPRPPLISWKCCVFYLTAERLGCLC